MNVTIGRAINLLHAGFSVMPIGEGKKPLLPWKRFQSEQITKEELEKVQSQTKGYGIITGYNDVECIDIDLKVFQSVQDGKKFWDEFVKFLQDHIDDFDKKFVIYKTINSGYHLIYRCKQIDGNQKIAKLKGHSQAIIETRGKGGYIFIYDNQISKNQYEDIFEITEEDREILFGVCRYFNYEEQEDYEVKKLKNESTGLTPWDDFNFRNDVIDIIQDEFNVIKTLSDRYVLRKKGSKDPHHGFIYKDSGLCFLFTTATIYPHEKPLSPFSCYAWKYFGGNFSEASKELYRQGYGERKIKTIEIERPDIAKEDLEFPLEIFPEQIQAYILQNQKTLGHSVDYMACSLLWMIGICLGNSCKAQVKVGWTEPANVWIGLIGKAGLGKTPSINAMIFPLNKKNSFEIKQFQNEYRKWKEYNSLTAKEKKDHEEIQEPKRNQFIVNDVTIEALADLHEEVEMGLGVFKDELNGWIKDMNKYKPGSDLEFWLSCWSNQQAILTRKTSKSSFIDSPCIQVLGGIQPGIFGQISTDENKDNGFLDRLLVCYPDKDIDPYNKNSIKQDVIEWYEAYIIQLFNLIRKEVLTIDKFGEIQKKIICFTKEAELEYERIFNNITKLQNSDDVNEYVKSMLAKQKSYVIRFSLLLNSINSYNNQTDFSFISKESVLQAEKLSNYFIAMSKKIKIQSIELGELRDFVKMRKGEPNQEIIKSVFEWNPNFNRSELAELLNVSRQLIYKHLKK